MLNVMNVAKWQRHSIDEASAYDMHSHVLHRKKSGQTVSNRANNASLGRADTLRHTQPKMPRSDEPNAETITIAGITGA
jgi:hypothetical protein